MSDCTCTNCIFIDNGMRYCYDCKQYTKMPPRDVIEKMIAEKRLTEAKKELGYESSTTL